ncbi:MAG: PhoH family protein [Victivallales bacterium]|nr:PhoH family protein [Victivallales bacterium]
MTEKEIVLDEPRAVNALFAGDYVNNKKFVEEHFSVEISAKNSRIKITSKNKDSACKAYTFISELVQIYESGYTIYHKDFELVLAAVNKHSSCSVKDLYSEIIKVSPNKNTIVPRTITQYNYIRAMKKKDVVFGAGPAGTGKTYLAMAMAISYFLGHNFDRIILTRPAIEAGENLGFLPGTLEEKIKPYLRPLYDALYEMLDFNEANRLIEDNVIELAPLAFMRGRTLNKSFIILDEAQNTTPEQMMMLLTRIGFESKCIITGDPTQTDLPGNRISGLVHAMKVLKQINEIAFLNFTSKDVVRNPLVEKIVNAYENGE